jgi:hypothetical protein
MACCHAYLGDNQSAGASRLVQLGALFVNYLCIGLQHCGALLLYNCRALVEHSRCSLAVVEQAISSAPTCRVRSEAGLLVFDKGPMAAAYTQIDMLHFGTLKGNRPSHWHGYQNMKAMYFYQEGVHNGTHKWQQGPRERDTNDER